MHTVNHGATSSGTVMLDSCPVPGVPAARKIEEVESVGHSNPERFIMLKLEKLLANLSEKTHLFSRIRTQIVYLKN